MDLGNETDLPKICLQFSNTPGIAWIEILNCIVTVPTSITATLANLVVIVSIWRTPSLHLPSNILLIGLALSDMAVGLVAQPSFFAYNFAKIKGLQSMLLCASSIANYLASYCLCGVSMLTLTAISLDRFMAIHLHLRYQEIMTSKRVTAMLIVIWLFCILFPPLFLWSLKFVGYFALVIIVLCFATTLFVYCKTYSVVRSHQVQINAQLQAMQSAQHQENAANFGQLKNSFINAFIIYFMFILCYFPYIVVMTLISQSDNTTQKQAAYEFAVLLVHINSTLNPFVYCWRYPPIRAAVIETAMHYWQKIRPPFQS